MAHESKAERENNFKQAKTAFKSILEMLSQDYGKGAGKFVRALAGKSLDVSAFMTSVEIVRDFFESLSKGIAEAQNEAAIEATREELSFFLAKVKEVKNILENAKPGYEPKGPSQGTQIVENLCQAKRHADLRTKLTDAFPLLAFLPFGKEPAEHLRLLLRTVNLFLEKECKDLEKKFALLESRPRNQAHIRAIEGAICDVVCEEVAQNKPDSYSRVLLTHFSSLGAQSENPALSVSIGLATQGIMTTKEVLLHSQQEAEATARKNMQEALAKKREYVAEVAKEIAALQATHEKSKALEKKQIDLLKKDLEKTREKEEEALQAWEAEEHAVQASKQQEKVALEAHQHGFAAIMESEEESKGEKESASTQIEAEDNGFAIVELEEDAKGKKGSASTHIEAENIGNAYPAAEREEEEAATRMKELKKFKARRAPKKQKAKRRDIDLGPPEASHPDTSPTAEQEAFQKLESLKRAQKQATQNNAAALPEQQAEKVKEEKGEEAFEIVETENPYAKIQEEATKNAVKKVEERREKKARKAALEVPSAEMLAAFQATQRAEKKALQAQKKYKKKTAAAQSQLRTYSDAQTAYSSSQIEREKECAIVSEKLQAAQQAVLVLEQQLEARAEAAALASEVLSAEQEEALQAKMVGLCASAIDAMVALNPQSPLDFEKIETIVREKKEAKEKKVAFAVSLQKVKEAIIAVVRQESLQNKRYTYSKELLGQFLSLSHIHPEYISAAAREIAHIQASSLDARAKVKSAEEKVARLQKQKTDLEKEKKAVETKLHDCQDYLEHATDSLDIASQKLEEALEEVEVIETDVDLKNAAVEEAHIRVNQIKIQRQEAGAVVAEAREYAVNYPFRNGLFAVFSADPEQAGQAAQAVAQEALPDAEAALVQAKIALVDAQEKLVDARNKHTKAGKLHAKCLEAQERWATRLREREMPEAAEKKAQDLQDLEGLLRKNSAALQRAEEALQAAAEEVIGVAAAAPEEEKMEAHPISPAEKEVADLTELMLTCCAAKAVLQEVSPDTPFRFTQIEALEKEMLRKSMLASREKYGAAPLPQEAETLSQLFDLIRYVLIPQEAKCAIPQKDSLVRFLLEELNNLAKQLLEAENPLGGSIESMLSEIKPLLDASMTTPPRRVSSDEAPIAQLKHAIAEKKVRIEKLEALNVPYQKAISYARELSDVFSLPDGMEKRLTQYIDQEKAALRAKEKTLEKAKDPSLRGKMNELAAQEALKEAGIPVGPPRRSNSSAFLPPPRDAGARQMERLEAMVAGL